MCPKPPSLPYGEITFNRTVPIAGTKATYTCSQGFKLSGNEEINCTSLGEWLGDTPECIRQGRYIIYIRLGQCVI